jgi:hypothetical protein
MTSCLVRACGWGFTLWVFGGWGLGVMCECHSEHDDMTSCLCVYREMT